MSWARPVRRHVMTFSPLLISLPVADRGRAHAFYRDGLGLDAPGEPAKDGVPEPLLFVLNADTRLMRLRLGDRRPHGRRLRPGRPHLDRHLGEAPPLSPTPGAANRQQGGRGGVTCHPTIRFGHRRRPEADRAHRAEWSRWGPNRECGGTCVACGRRAPRSDASSSNAALRCCRRALDLRAGDQLVQANEARGTSAGVATASQLTRGAHA